MQRLKRNILLRIAWILCSVCVATSCVYDDILPENEPTLPDNRTLLSISFRLPDMGAQSRADGSYEDGVDYENYVDIYNGGFRIYIFDADNKYLSRFVPMLIDGPDASSGHEYKVQGILPDDIAERTALKIVVLANWPSYPDDRMEVGTTTIEDVCNDASSQFDCLSSFELNPDKGLIIPFFGVHHYTGLKFEKGKCTSLTEPVALLRAMAKVEIVVETDGISLSDVGLRGYNSRGYCAPSGVYSQTEYDHNGSWSDDYVKKTHLVGGANDYDNVKADILPLFRKYQNDGTHKETWIAYVPEYRNTGDDDYKSHIEFHLDIQGDGANPYKVYFTDYGENGKIKPTPDSTTLPADTKYYDVLRNNCYRFTLSIDKGLLIIKVKQWENTYDNNFIFK